MAHASRAEFEASLAHWRTLGVGEISTRINRAEVDEGGYVMATLERHCAAADAVHLAGWIEVQAILAEGAHYSRFGHGGQVFYTLYMSRATDELDADEDAQ